MSTRSNRTKCVSRTPRPEFNENIAEVLRVYRQGWRIRCLRPSNKAALPYAALSLRRVGTVRKLLPERAKKYCGVCTTRRIDRVLVLRFGVDPWPAGGPGGPFVSSGSPNSCGNDVTGGDYAHLRPRHG